jgi:hypothetical protein
MLPAGTQAERTHVRRSTLVSKPDSMHHLVLLASCGCKNHKRSMVCRSLSSDTLHSTPLHSNPSSATVLSRLTRYAAFSNWLYFILFLILAIFVTACYRLSGRRRWFGFQRRRGVLRCGKQYEALFCAGFSWFNIYAPYFPEHHGRIEQFVS